MKTMHNIQKWVVNIFIELEEIIKITDDQKEKHKTELAMKWPEKRKIKRDCRTQNIIIFKWEFT